MRNVAASLLHKNTELEQNLSTEIRLKCQYQLTCKEIEKQVEKRHYLSHQPELPNMEEKPLVSDEFTVQAKKEKPLSLQENAAKAAREQADKEAVKQEELESRKRKLETLVTGDFSRLDKIFQSETGIFLFGMCVLKLHLKCV